LRIGCAVVKGCGFEVAKLKVLIAWLTHLSLVSALRLGGSLPRERLGWFGVPADP
jgi:hypothetical protein